MLYLKLRLFNVYITYILCKNEFEKKINLIYFFENFLKVEKKKPYNAS